MTLLLAILSSLAVALWLVARLVNLLVPPRRLMQAEDARLSPCGQLRNCACSCETKGDLSDSQQHSYGKMPPIEYAGEWKEVMGHLTSIVARFPRSRVAESRPGYLRVEFRSRLFGFVDDTEFLLDDALHRINFRSAARLGVSDFGVNRRRIEQITRCLADGP